MRQFRSSGIAGVLLSVGLVSICWGDTIRTRMQFCSSELGSAGSATPPTCRADAPLEQQLNTANRLFARHDYARASKAYIEAFKDTPLRPVNNDTAGLMVAALNQVGQYERALDEVLRRDRLVAIDDFRYWPDIALISWYLARSTSVEFAQETLARVFANRSSKLESRVWPLIPAATTKSLKDHKFSTSMIYGPETEYPVVRRNLQNFIAQHPGDKFIELAYLSIGDLETAVAVAPKSPIGDVLHYARAYMVIESIYREAQAYFDDHPTESVRDTRVNNLVEHFEEKANAARPDLEAVVRNWPQYPHADDAAFWLGWLSFQEGDDSAALDHFDEAMLVGNQDYTHGVTIYAMHTIQSLSPAEQRAVMESHAGLSKIPALWYVAARSAYRAFDYKAAISTGERGLATFRIPADRLPQVTEAGPIHDALVKILYPNVNRRSSPNSDDDGFQFVDPNLEELPYLIQASREMLAYETALTGQLGARFPPKRIKDIVTKYTRKHRDYRQGIHLIDLAIPNVQDSNLLDWLYYRKIRSLVLFKPEMVSEAVAEFGRARPKSKILANAIAEQLYADVYELGDIDDAKATFDRLVVGFQETNAIDNAMNLMSNMYRCSGNLEESRKIDSDIVRKFVLSRFAFYAIQRSQTEKTTSCSEPDEAGRVRVQAGEADAQYNYKTKRTTAVRSSPSGERPKLFDIRPNIKLILVRGSKGWLIVQLGDKVGFIAEEDVECVADCPK